LPGTAKALKLIRRIRDEVHRFKIHFTEIKRNAKDTFKKYELGNIKRNKANLGCGFY
jgi:excinuclease UvrABC nuclease subunit